MPTGEPEEIFEAALALPPGERSALLERECAGAPELRAELEAMLELAAREPRLLEPPPRHDLHRRIGRYDILGSLGSGGMGEVYEGFDPTLGRRVAIKLIAPALGMPAAAADRLQREARILASLGDPRVATLYSLEESDGATFITMERVEGRTLAERLREGPLPEPEALGVCVQVARALEAAHALGIVHRDLKPGNVMIRDDASVKVIDFGVAKLLGEASPAGITPAGGGQATLAAGTPAYMSPEQLMGGAITPQTDMWAFGCLIFECLTGERAVALPTAAGASATGERASGVTAVPAAPGPELGRLRSARLRRLVRDCLADRPEDRPASMTRLRETLEAETPSAKGSRRRRWAAAVAALLTLAAAGVTVYSFLPGDVAGVEVIDASVVRGVDAKGRARWTRTFPGGVASLPRVITDPADHRNVWEGDQLQGTVVFPVENGAAVLGFLDAATGETRWQRPVSWSSPVNERGPVRYRWAQVFSWPEPERQAISVSVVDGAWYSCALQFFALDGRLIGEYSHPGKIFPGGEARADSNGGAPLLFWGVNSSARFDRRLVPFETSLHPACVLLLDPSRIGGQAYPYSMDMPEARDWPGMPRAAEAGYLLVAPLTPNLSCAATAASFTHSSVEGTAVELVLADERRFRLGADLTPRSCFLPPGHRATELLAGKDSIEVFMVRAEKLVPLRVKLER